MFFDALMTRRQLCHQINCKNYKNSPNIALFDFTLKEIKRRFQKGSLNKVFVCLAEN